MNKGKFPHDKKQNPFQSQGNKPQWPGQAGHGPQKPNEHNPGHHGGHGPQGGNPNKPQWPGHKDKR